MKKKIKLFDPYVGAKEKKYVLTALQSHNWASGAGSDFVRQFESKFCKYIGAKNCVSVNSGTAALHLALLASDVSGKEVIVPSLTFVSTAHAALYNNGKVVFADIDPDTLCMDPDSVKKKITKNTKVILPVHFAGMSADMKSLQNLAKESNSLLIDDAAHAAGAKFNGKKIGSLGDMSCFSFHPVKNLAMPTGGLVAVNHTNHKKMRQVLLSGRWCGITDRKEANYDIKTMGWNFYMNEFSAAIGLAQLSSLDKLNKKRMSVAAKFHKMINLERKMPLNNNCSYHFYWILVKNRDQFRKKLASAGIETGIHYKPVHKMSMYANGVKLPITEQTSQQIVTLPTHPNLTEDDVDIIVNSVNNLV
ncbi:MAG: DegT/DnrJ/EryC1/StrS family aminotransferase [Nitrososphaeria archaeon]|nr:DegT/DnrJ/EryC1/StrS family aminotransferase [Nitrososphaeria archaeon]